MADQITSAQQNPDGSFTFGFIFDAGNGVTGVTEVILPAPVETPAILDDSGNVITPAVAATPYTLDTAKTAVLPLATAQKAQWMTSIGSAAVIGNVTL